MDLLSAKPLEKVETMKGFKTVIYGVMIALVSIFSNAEMQDFIAANIPAVGSALGTGIIILRALTTSSIFANVIKGKSFILIPLVFLLSSCGVTCLEKVAQLEVGVTGGYKTMNDALLLGNMDKDEGRKARATIDKVDTLAGSALKLCGDGGEVQAEDLIAEARLLLLGFNSNIGESL